jgi:hypothetical protein
MASAGSSAPGIRRGHPRTSHHRLLAAPCHRPLGPAAGSGGGKADTGLGRGGVGGPVKGPSQAHQTRSRSTEGGGGTCQRALFCQIHASARDGQLVGGGGRSTASCGEMLGMSPCSTDRRLWDLQRRPAADDTSPRRAVSSARMRSLRLRSCSEMLGAARAAWRGFGFSLLGILLDVG